jgi:hypothetical protein
LAVRFPKQFNDGGDFRKSWNKNPQSGSFYQQANFAIRSAARFADAGSTYAAPVALGFSKYVALCALLFPLPRIEVQCSHTDKSGITHVSRSRVSGFPVTPGPRTPPVG